MQNLRLLYDISVLGPSTFYEVNRTGVFRVTEELLVALNQRTDLQIDFCALESIPHVYYAMKYLEQSGCIGQEHSFIFDPSLYPYIRHLDFLFKRTMLLHRVYRKALSVFRKNGVLLHPLRNKPYHVYHSNFYGIPDRRFRHGLPTIITVYDVIPILHPEYFRLTKGAQRFRRLLASIDNECYVVCISQCTRNDLLAVRSDLDPSRVFVNHLGASSLFGPESQTGQWLKYRNQLRLPENALMMLSVGTLEPRKNVSFLIGAFRELVRSGFAAKHNLYLVLVGTLGWDISQVLGDYNSQEELVERIVFTGYIPDSLLPVLYSNCAVFIYPSLYEGFGLPVVEAMKCGAPVITSNTSSFPEVVGTAGLMIDPHVKEDLVAAIEKVILDDQLRRELKAKSMEQASKFIWAHTAQRMVNIYNNIAGT